MKKISVVIIVVTLLFVITIALLAAYLPSNEQSTLSQPITTETPHPLKI
jgi:hypothetical protein